MVTPITENEMDDGKQVELENHGCMSLSHGWNVIFGVFLGVGNYQINPIL